MVEGWMPFTQPFDSALVRCEFVAGAIGDLTQYSALPARTKGVISYLLSDGGPVDTFYILVEVEDTWFSEATGE